MSRRSLEFSDGRVLTDSTRILQTLCPFLYDADGEAAEWERRLDARLGPAVRCFAYHHLLAPEHGAALTALSTNQTSLIEVRRSQRWAPAHFSFCFTRSGNHARRRA